MELARTHAFDPRILRILRPFSRPRRPVILRAFGFGLSGANATQENEDESHLVVENEATPARWLEEP